MAHKMLDSTPPSRPSQQASMYGNDSLELLCQNGEIHVQGDPPRTTRNGPSCIGYSVNSRRGEAYDIEEDSRTTKRARLNTIDRFLDKSGQRNFHLDSPGLNFQQSKNAYDTYKFDLQYPKSSNNSIKHLPNTHLMLEDKSANLRPKKESKITRGGLQLASTSDNSEICTPFLQQCLDSARMMKIAATTGGPMPIPIKVNNFSNFSRYAGTFKSTHHQGSNEIRPTSSPALARLEKMKAGEDDKKPAAAGRTNEPECVVIDSAKSSHSLAGFREQTALTASKANPVPLFAHNAYQLLPDEHSEAIGHSNTLIHGSHCKHCNRTLAENRPAKGKPITDLCNEPLIAWSSSVCSPGVSSDQTYLSRKHEETDESTDLSNSLLQNDDEAEGVIKEAPRAKRSRSSEVHNYSEKKQKRRDKINKKMRALKELIPNCNKMDKASMLDDAIGYIMALKLQLQIMSMGTSLCVPYMMLPAGAHHMPQFPTMGAGMGLRPNPALPCSLPQYPPPLLAPASLPGSNDNRLQMFGLANQVLPMSISHAPFIPMMLGKPFTQPIVAPLKATSSSLTTSMDSVADNSDLNAKVQCAVMQTSNQASKLRPS